MHQRKRFATHRLTRSPGHTAGLVALGMVLLLASSVPAQRLPLPPHEQEEVNNAIDRGVTYLKRTQQKNGTWANPQGNWAEARFHGHVYAIGFTALPGLTLLECGVPPSDPIIQQAAQFVRSKATQLDRTYELALAILFLDRLGDPADKKLIQTFALRLIAGQSATGGWGYKCPILGSKTQMDLLTALRHLDPPDEMPDIARRGKKPGDLNLIGRVPGAPVLEGKAVRPGSPSTDNSIARSGAPSMNDSLAQSGSSRLSGSLSRGSSGEASSLAGSTVEGDSSESSSLDAAMALPPDHWRDCLGLAMLDEYNPGSFDSDPKEKDGQKPSPTKPEGKADDNRTPDLKADQRKSTKPYVIPERIKVLPVIQEPGMHALQDPLGRSEEPFLTTTDNSNTQFAILALWRAQQHDVPTKRSLNMIARRYLTSQNADGSWGYHYQFGGGGMAIQLPNSMICVGLIGLAVGHGLAQAKPAGQPAQDARIINGLIALSANIGQPVENRSKLTMQNLYFLWSLERVAVLYNLPVIGDKDWYRWGAQVLVRNQQNDGNWAGGLYIGSKPPIDTCLALLFLKRANLVKDLTAKLPFSADDLNKSIMEKLAPSPKQTAPPKQTKETKRPVEPPKPNETEKVAITAPRPVENTAEVDNSTENTGSSKKKWLIVFGILFLAFSGGSLVLILLAINQRKETKAEEPSKRKKRSMNRDSKGNTKAAPSSSRN